MDKSLIFSKLQKKAEELEIIENLYEDDIFANYYRSIVNQDELLEDDIDSYKQFFDKSMPILEIGSGTGRIFNPLFEDGYNIFGLEPAKEWQSILPMKAEIGFILLPYKKLGIFRRKTSRSLLFQQLQFRFSVMEISMIF